MNSVATRMKEWKRYDAFTTRELALKYATDVLKSGVAKEARVRKTGFGRLPHELWIIERQ